MIVAWAGSLLLKNWMGIKVTLPNWMTKRLFNGGWYERVTVGNLMVMHPNIRIQAPIRLWSPQKPIGVGGEFPRQNMI